MAGNQPWFNVSSFISIELWSIVWKDGSRSMSLDIAKGACMIGVVAVHSSMDITGGSAGWVSEVTTQGNSVAGAFISFLYTLLMGFFIISGYLYKPGRTFKENISRRVLSIIPLFILGIFVLTTLLWAFINCTSMSLGLDTLVDSVFHSLIGTRTFMPYPESYDLGPCDATEPFYYLAVYVVACIPFYAVVDKVVGSWKRTVAAVAVLAGISAILIEVLPVHLPFACETAFAASGMMLLGAFLVKNDVLTRLEGWWNRWWYIPAIIAITVVGIALSTVFPFSKGFIDGRFGEYGGFSALVVFPIAMVSWTWLMMLSVLVSKIPLFRLMVAIPGLYSLAVLMLHFFFLKILGGLINPIESGGMPIETIGEGAVLGIISIVLSVFVAVGVSFVIRKARGGFSASGIEPDI